MSDNSAAMLATLQEMRDLLLLMAEPPIAKRDENPRKQLIAVAGSSENKQVAICLMNGSRTKAQIHKESG